LDLELGRQRERAEHEPESRPARAVVTVVGEPLQRDADLDGT
jgi:hypothetical protein